MNSTHLLATYDRISRTFLYQLLLAANLQLEVLFSDEKLLSQKDPQHLEHLLLLFRLEGKCSLLRLSAILTALQTTPIPWAISGNSSTARAQRFLRPS